MIGINSWTLLKCPRCKGAGRDYIDDGGEICCLCRGSRFLDTTPFTTLAYNLGIVAGLERAWLLGHSRGVFRPLKTDDEEIKVAYERDVWAPGRGRSAP
jgi:hypothetical protein